MCICNVYVLPSYITLLQSSFVITFCFFACLIEGLSHKVILGQFLQTHPKNFSVREFVAITSDNFTLCCFCSCFNRCINFCRMVAYIA
ncbi:hypothetical protein CW304_04530 [Bacillus sp. UFRGS-B20]|nr:hypothetical protein CW304_04530 [Bacillus sp. UFRGS-B20]